MSLRLGSLANPNDVQQAINIVVEGGYIGTQYHGAFILIFSGTNLEAKAQALAAKNEEDTNKPLSSLALSKQIFPFIDHNRLRHANVKRLLEDNNQFKSLLGALCHVRLPLIRKVMDGDLPMSMMSEKNGIPYVQMLDPYGNLLFSNLIHELKAVGVRFVAATSLNLKDESEICELSDARDFCDQRDVPYLLHDPLFGSSEVKGSFLVLDLENNVAIRGRHIPIQLIERIVGWEFDKTDMKPSKHPHAQYLEVMCAQDQLSGGMLRAHILNHFYGK